MPMYNRRKVEIIKERSHQGTRICLDSMENDPQPIPSGTKGTVIAVDDAGQLLMKWDNGRFLSLIPKVGPISCNSARGKSV